MIQSTVCSGCKNKKCANKIESHWRDAQGSVQTIEDCAPRRSLLLMQENCNRLLAHQSALEQVRDEVADMKKVLATLAEQFAMIHSHAEFAPIPISPKRHRDDLRSLPNRGV